jgi:DNA-binding NarL/FixJ family response regulator
MSGTAASGPARKRGGVPRSEGDVVTCVIGHFEPVFEVGLKMLLREDRGVRVLASEVADATLEDVVARHRPRVVIVGETVESDVLARLKSRRSVMGVLVIAQAPSAQCGTLLLANGASCVARSTPEVDILAAIRSAAKGEPVLVDAVGRVVHCRPGDVLTPRELEVFAHLRVGWTYEEIAGELHISPTTVRSHTVNICRKLGVSGKRELKGWSSW